MHKKSGFGTIALHLFPQQQYIQVSLTFTTTIRSIACARKESGSLARNPVNNEGA